MQMEQEIIKLVSDLINVGGGAAIWIGGIFVALKFGTPVITAGVVLRGVRLIIREVAEAKRAQNEWIQLHTSMQPQPFVPPMESRQSLDPGQSGGGHASRVGREWQRVS